MSMCLVSVPVSAPVALSVSMSLRVRDVCVHQFSDVYRLGVSLGPVSVSAVCLCLMRVPV